MTSRERVLGAVSGKATDRRPVMAWPFWNSGSDFRHFGDNDLPARIEAEDSIALVEVTNPFGLALQRRVDLNGTLKQDPRRGNEQLAELVEISRRAIGAAFEAGADGILYRLFGARAIHCTPMQYGGYYLERDRELLEYAANSTFNVVFVVGEEDVYLDFVSDLPASALGWDSRSSNVSAAEVRQMRVEALLSEDPQSNILLEPGTTNLSRMLETCVKTEDSYAI